MLKILRKLNIVYFFFVLSQMTWLYGVFPTSYLISSYQSIDTKTISLA